MYYISRVVTRGRYGVVDTDDGKESIMSTSEIKKAVIELGFQIAGVTVKSTRQGWTLEKIVAYQPPKSVSTKQVKAKVMQGVDVSKNGDVVVGISVTPRTIQPLSIRLSDFGTQYGKYVLKDRTITGNVIFVLDDSLKINQLTFRDWYGNVSMDFREVTKQSILDAVLSDDFFDRYVIIGRLNLLDTAIIDRPERMSYCKAVWLVCFNFVNQMQLDVAIKVAPTISPEAKTLVAKRFSRKFLNLGKADVKVLPNAFSSDLEMCKTVCRRIREAGLTATSSFDDWLWYETRLDFLGRLKYLINVDFGAIMKFKNYTRFFQPSAEVKAAFVQFMDKAVTAITNSRAW